MIEITLTINESVLNIHFNIVGWFIIYILNKCIKINDAILFNNFLTLVIFKYDS